ncbi:MAG: tRNA pseudouridine(55) synthase TruB [Flavobacteriaceae bacterium]|nr:tRNA pseudouridine(55) synthase TruB [Flavobacteriaceae bacterium]|tara:strand:+ start:56751 stop:57452 length:702 start_codon:yes stop_codon:yes gene_type:complete
MEIFNNNLNQVEEGILILIDKPIKWTSFEVVKKIRYVLKKTTGKKKLKVGHAGTLDPLASGLLVIATGKATKKISLIQNMNKSYIGKIILGSTTPSFDLETKINNHFPTEHINLDLINKTKEMFVGRIKQTPPIYSAIKINGKRLYEYARNNQQIQISKREVEIKKFDIKSFNINEIEFIINCSKGTYIRSLVNDFGLALNSGAYLSSLRRISIGNYSIKNAIKINAFEKQFI